MNQNSIQLINQQSIKSKTKTKLIQSNNKKCHVSNTTKLNQLNEPNRKKIPPIQLMKLLPEFSYKKHIVVKFFIRTSFSIYLTNIFIRIIALIRPNNLAIN